MRIGINRKKTRFNLAFRGQNTLRALLIREEVPVDELLRVIAIIESDMSNFREQRSALSVEYCSRV
jgi:hypothetical protein